MRLNYVSLIVVFNVLLFCGCSSVFTKIEKGKINNLGKMDLASLEDRNKSGYTPLMYAVNNKNFEALNVLLSKGVDLEKKYNNGETALVLASLSNWEDGINVLIDKGSNVASTYLYLFNNDIDHKIISKIINFDKIKYIDFLKSIDEQTIISVCNTILSTSNLNLAQDLYIEINYEYFNNYLKKILILYFEDLVDSSKNPFEPYIALRKILESSLVDHKKVSPLLIAEIKNKLNKHFIELNIIGSVENTKFSESYVSLSVHGKLEGVKTMVLGKMRAFDKFKDNIGCTYNSNCKFDEPAICDNGKCEFIGYQIEPPINNVFVIKDLLYIPDTSIINTIKIKLHSVLTPGTRGQYSNTTVDTKELPMSDADRWFYSRDPNYVPIRKQTTRTTTTSNFTSNFKYLDRNLLYQRIKHINRVDVYLLPFNKAVFPIKKYYTDALENSDSLKILNTDYVKYINLEY